MNGGPIRDNALLDALETLERSSFEGHVWRSVRSGRHPDECWRSGGRWDDRTFDVLYTSTSRDAAIEERRFHLFRGQPIAPSKVTYDLFELSVTLQSVVTFPDLEALKSVGLDVNGYGKAHYPEREVEYPRSQQVAEACHFLGADGILVPSARKLDVLNLIVFCEQDTGPQIETVANHGSLEF